MADKMSRWGVGPSFAALSFVCLCIAIIAERSGPALADISIVPYGALLSIGLSLIALGLVFYIAAVISIMRAYNADRLCTTGPTGLCRHPIYAAWAVFIIPGIALLLNSWIALATIPVICLILRVLVRKEERYLEHRFGDEYRVYRSRVPAILPLGWLKTRLTRSPTPPSD